MTIFTLSKKKLLFLFLFLANHLAFSQGVTYNLLGTGSGVSADRALGGSEEAFHLLAPLNIDQNIASTNGFTPNVTNHKFKFSISQYWRFEPNTASIVVSSHFTAASISVSETEVEVTYSTSADMKGASMKIDGLKVQSLNPRNMAEGKITYVQVNPIAGIDNNADIGTLKQVAGKVRKLMVILPGETYSQDPLIATGKTGIPTTQTVGKPFQIEVRTVDENFNVATHEQDGNSNLIAIGHEIGFSSSDLEIVTDNINLTAGIGEGTAIMMSAGTHQITANDITRPGIASATSTNFNVIKTPFSKLLLMLPGETYSFESPTGKVGITHNQSSGDNFSAIVYATDQYWVIDETVNGQVQVSHDDIYGSAPITVNFVNGVATISGIQFNTSGNFVVSSSYLSGTGITAGTSNIHIDETAYDKIIALLPYQEYVPGSGTGISGQAIIPERGTAFNVRIIAADINSNKVYSINNPLDFTSSDPAALFVSNASFVNGEYILSLNLNSPGEQTLTITDPLTSKSKIVTIGNPTPATDPAGYFRSRKSGNWEDATVWENSTDGLEWYSSTDFPTDNAKSVLIRSGSQVSIYNDHYSTITGLIIEENAIFNIANVEYFILDNIEVHGKVIDYGSYFFANNLTFKNNSIYDNKSSYPLLPAGAIWETGSTCIISGNLVNGTLEFTNQDIYNLKYEPISQLNNMIFSDFNGVRNDFTINSTGGKNLILHSNSAAGFTKNISVKNYIQNGGTVELLQVGTPYLPSKILNFIITDSFVFNKGMLIKMSNPTIGKIQLSSLAPNVVIGADALFGGNVTVEFTSINAVIDLKSYEFKGSSGTFTVSANSTVKTSHPSGISTTGATGNVQFTGTRTFPATATIEYNGAVTQNTGNVITGDMGTGSKILVNNPNGVVYNQTANISNATSTNIIINQGYLDLGTNTYSGTQFGGNGELRLAGVIPTLTWTNGTIHAYGTSAQSIPASTYNNLKLSGGAKTLSGSITINGDFDASGATSINTATYKVIYSGTGNQNVAGIPYYDLDVTGAGIKTITAPATVSNNVKVTTGTLNANGNLTLLADANKYANVEPLSGSAAITGTTHVQVYINSGYRGTRTLSSPIQEGNNVLSQLKNAVIIAAGSAPSNGLDIPSGGGGFKNPFISFYNESTTGAQSFFTFIHDINTNVPKGQGFFLTYVGNRNGIDQPGKIIPPFSSTVEATTVTYSGTLNAGNVSVPLSYTETPEGELNASYDGLFLAGNPYASTIDWGKVYADNPHLASSIYIVKGGYHSATYNAIGNVSLHGGTAYIKPGQGFYVQTTGPGNSLLFKESHKEVSNHNGNTLMRNNKEIIQLMSANGTVSETKQLKNDVQQIPRRLIKMQLSNSFGEDESAIVFSSEFNDSADQFDSKYLSSVAEANLASYSMDDQKLAINLSNDIQETKEVKLDVLARNSGEQKLKLTEVNGLEKFRILLKDNYNGQVSDLSETDNEYLFTVDKNTSSTFGANRLSLVFMPDNVLSINETSFKIVRTNKAVTISWETAGKKEISEIIVERASNDKEFKTLMKVVPVNQNSFSVEDNMPLNGANYYRIKSVYSDGTFVYSSVKSITFGLDIPTVTFYPNPVKDYLTVEFYEKKADQVIIKAFDISGKNVKYKSGNMNEINKLDLSALKSGIYFIEVRTLKGEVINRFKIAKE